MEEKRRVGEGRRERRGVERRRKRKENREKREKERTILTLIKCLVYVNHYYKH